MEPDGTLLVVLQFARIRRLKSSTGMPLPQNHDPVTLDDA